MIVQSGTPNARPPYASTDQLLGDVLSAEPLAGFAESSVETLSQLDLSVLSFPSFLLLPRELPITLLDLHLHV